MEHRISAVGTLDKALFVLGAIVAEPRTLPGLVDATGLSRATAHRLARALEAHGLVRRDETGRYLAGLGLLALGRAAAESVPLAGLAHPALVELRDRTGESAQLYVRQGGQRVCVAALESAHGLRTIVPLGASLPLGRGSAGRILAGEAGAEGWVESVEEREPGVASVSAPVADPGGAVVAAVSVSGPVDRTSRRPGAEYGAAVLDAAGLIEAAVRE